MTVVVADTSPVNYLLLIGEIAILPSLYGRSSFLPKFWRSYPTPMHRPNC
jgi:hypothetical protein